MLPSEKDKQIHFKKKYTFNDSRFAKNGNFRVAFQQSGSSKSQLDDWLHSCDAPNKAEHVKALHQHSWTESKQREHRAKQKVIKRPNSIKFIQIPN